MRLERLRIKNYKAIEDSEWLSIDDLSILIGKNDAGKSTLLESIKILLLESEKIDSAHFHMNSAEECTICGEFVDIPSELSQNLKEDIDVSDDTLRIEKRFKNRGSKSPKREIYLGENREKLLKGAVIRNGERLNKAPSRRFIWEFLPEPLYVPAERDVSEQTSFKSNTFISRLLNPILKQSEDIDDKISDLESSLSEEMEELSDDLTERLSSHMDTISRVSVETTSIDVSKSLSPNISISDTAIEQSIPISERGSGVGSLFILSLVEEYKDKHIGEGYFLLFEEPGVWLHPGAQRRMLSAIKSISQEGGQIALSTHSPIFIDRRGSANMFIVKRQDGVSNMRFLSSDYFSIIDEIGARSSDVLQSDFVIYTEGINDVRSVKVVAKHYIDDWDELNIVIQHLGGRGNLDHCEPKELAKINKNFGFILDSDKSPIEGDPNSTNDSVNSTAKYLQQECEKLELDIPVLVLNRREMENYFTATGIHNAIGLDVDEEFTTKYGDMKEKLESEMNNQFDGIYPQSKSKDIINEMYKDGDSIPEIERFLDEVI